MHPIRKMTAIATEKRVPPTYLEIWLPTQGPLIVWKPKPVFWVAIKKHKKVPILAKPY